jgi:hypothetical protein
MRGRRGPDSRIWEAVFQIGDQRVGPRSLGEVDQSRALFVAVEMKARLVLKLKHGEAVTQSRAQHSFGEAAEAALVELRNAFEATKEREGRERAEKHATHIRRIENILIPALGPMPVRSITPDYLHDWTHSLAVKINLRPGSPTRSPSQSTIGNIGHSFTKVMKVAVRKGWISDSARPMMSKKGFEEGEARPGFTHAEVLQIAEAMTPAWMAKAPKQVSRDMRAICRVYVAVATCTGMRPGTEMDRLSWGRLNDHRGSAVFKVLRSQGKRRLERDAYAYHGKDAPFDLKEELLVLHGLADGRNRDPSYPLFARPSDGVVGDFSGIFRTLLTEIDLLTERESGEERCLYSLRHYYGTEACARSGWESMMIADQMGTSVDMLSRYYNKNRTRRHAAILSGLE